VKKISELIEYRNNLKLLKLDHISEMCSIAKNEIDFISTAHSVADRSALLKLKAALSMYDSVVMKNLDQEISSINDSILSLELNYQTLSSTLYNTKFKVENYEVRKAAWPLDDSFKSFVKSITEKYADYKYPALEISPMYSDITHVFTSFEPIYLIDQDPSLLASILSDFDEKYRQKFRTYVMNIRGSINNLPLENLCFVLAVNAFERYDSNALESVLLNIKKLLLPGASIAFTFNNCDYASGAKQVEVGRACYQTTKSIKALLGHIGFPYITFSVYNEYQTIVEAKLPGELRTIKNNPVIGQIMDVERIDKDDKEAYYTILKGKN
jgi:hypothetical protein